MAQDRNGLYGPWIMIGVVCCGVLTFDLSFPLGVAGAVPYIGPIVLTLWISGKSATLKVALITSALTVLGYLASPPGGVLWVSLVNRFLALAIIWIGARLVIGRKEMVAALEKKFEDRSEELRRKDREQALMLSINHIVQQMVRPPDIERFLKICYTELQAFGQIFETLLIHLIDAEKECVTTYQIDRTVQITTSEATPTEVYQIWQGENPVYYSDLNTHPQATAHQVAKHYGLGTGSLFGVPHEWGALVLFSSELEGFNSENQQTITKISEVLSVGIKRISDLEELESVEKELRQHEKELLVHRRQLQSLGAALALAEERERRRLAMDLHDRIGQNLALSKNNAGQLLDSVSDPAWTEKIQALYELLDQTVKDTRSLSFELSPPVLYELGLEAGLEWLAEHFQSQHDLAVHLHTDHSDKRLEEELEIILFRSVRELLLNAVKYAHASLVEIHIEHREDQITVTVRDDGVGFEVSESAPLKGFGLFNIRERIGHLNGTVKIDSAPNQGTTIRIQAPLKGGEKSSLASGA